MADRRPRLEEGRRISINVNLSPRIHHELGRICNGNRSAAIERLVEDHLKRMRESPIERPT
jgi:hypothetical protein